MCSKTKHTKTPHAFHRPEFILPFLSIHCSKVETMRFPRHWMLSLMTVLATSTQAQDTDPARQLLNSGRLAEAIEAYSQRLQASPGHVDWLLMRGLAYSRTGQWSLAIQDLEAASERAPRYVDVWTALGNVYRWNDRPADAARAYARWVDLEPQNVSARVLLGRMLMDTGDIAGAQQQAQAARAAGGTPDELSPLASALHRATQANAPAAGGHRWGLSYSNSNTTTSIGQAHEQTLSLRRYTEYGSIAVEQLHLQRYGQSDRAIAIDAYPRLWQGAYANLRYQGSDSASLYPQTAWRAELYQGLGNGWEGAVSHDHLGFDSVVRIDGVAMARYWGNFYARWRHQRVHSDTSSGSGNRFMLRYYYEGDAEHYLEANYSSGRSDDFGGTIIANSRTRSDSRGLAWYHFVTRDWGFKTSMSRANDTSLSGGYEHNWSVGLMYRW